MASSRGLNIEITGGTTTEKEAHAAVRKVMQAFRIPRLPHERFDMSVDTIISDAARVLGCTDYYWWYGTDGYTFFFNFE